MYRLPPMATEKPPYLQSALLHIGNLAAMVGAAVTSLAMHQAAPMGIFMGVELVYLALVPAIPAFRRGVERKLMRKRSEEASKLADEMLQELSANQREHFFALRDLKERILENYRRLSSSGLLLLTSETRIDQLLASFLRLLSALNAYRKYLGQSNREQVQLEASELTADLERDPGGERVREVKQKRLEILRKRLARFEKAAEHRELMSHQLASIEDILRLLHEQSIGMRDPEVVTRQLETVTAEVETTESTVKELEEFLSFDESVALPHASQPDRVRD